MSQIQEVDALNGQINAQNKSILTFAVRPYEDDLDLESLAKRIQAEVIEDGLIWREWNLVQMIYGMKGIHITALVEDDVASIQKVVEQIQELSEDIQSVDLVVSRKYKGQD